MAIFINIKDLRHTLAVDDTVEMAAAVVNFLLVHKMQASRRRFPRPLLKL